MKTPLDSPTAPARLARAPFHLLTRRADLCAGLFLALLAFVAPPTRADVTEAWVHRYNNLLSNANDQAVKVVRDAAGDIIVTGTTDDGITGRDILTIKYSGADGSVLWQRRYNGPASGGDESRALAVDGSDNVVVTGYSQGDYYTAKYAAADGALLWEQRYHGPASWKGGVDATSLALGPNGMVAITGSSSGDYATVFTGRLCPRSPSRSFPLALGSALPACPAAATTSSAPSP